MRSEDEARKAVKTHLNPEMKPHQQLHLFTSFAHIAGAKCGEGTGASARAGSTRCVYVYIVCISGSVLQ